MPDNDPRDGFFYLPLTPMTDPYNLNLRWVRMSESKFSDFAAPNGLELYLEKIKRIPSRLNFCFLLKFYEILSQFFKTTEL